MSILAGLRSIKPGTLSASILLLWPANCARADSSVAIGSARGYPNTTASAPVIFRKVTNVVAAQFDVSFDTSKVSSGDPVPGALLANQIVKSREIAPGIRRTLIYSLSNSPLTTTNSAVIAGLPFTVSATEHVGSGPLTPTQALLVKPDATPISPLNLMAGAIFVQALRFNGDGSVSFLLPSEPNQTYLIQASTNLVNWTTILTNMAAGTYMDLYEPNGGNFRYRFYRSMLEP